MHNLRFSLFAVVLLTLAVLTMPATSAAQIGIAIRIGPPALPVYEQPPCPAEGYLWTPGYWAYDYDAGDYYWVPGTWVMAPQVGFLWTPGWWGWGGGAFLFHEGYWGPHIGFYGGINYGFGYFGNGYEGGRWDHDHFYYNRSVNNVNVTNIHNVYNTTVINNVTINRVSYNGGNGGINARATRREEEAERDRHLGPVGAQTEHVQSARANRELRASVNQGRPPIAATARPGEFSGREVVSAREAGAPYRNEPPRSENNVPRPPAATHAKDLQPHGRFASPNTGNPKQDQKYQRQQEKMYASQEREHQKVTQQQEKEHERVAKQNLNEARTQQMEQRHQQQTQQMEERHVQQQQHLQEKQQHGNGGRPK